MMSEVLNVNTVRIKNILLMLIEKSPYSKYICSKEFQVNEVGTDGKSPYQLLSSA